jgi:hypothetical protein
MNPEEVARTCDELHEYIDQGPGENPGVFARALSVVRRLRTAGADRMTGRASVRHCCRGSRASRMPGSGHGPECAAGNRGRRVLLKDEGRPGASPG